MIEYRPVRVKLKSTFISPASKTCTIYPHVVVCLLVIIASLGIHPITGSPIVGEENSNQIPVTDNEVPEELQGPLIEETYRFLKPIDDDDPTKPTSEEEKERIEAFDPKNYDYDALREALLNELGKKQKRHGRLLGVEPKLPAIFSNLGRMLDLNQVVNEIETSIMSSVSCNACIGGVSLLQTYVEGGQTRQQIIESAIQLCKTFQIETPRVCIGVIHLMADEVLYVIQDLVLTPDEICGFIIGDICGTPYNPYHNWTVVLPTIPKPPIQWVAPQADKPSMKVLHLSDTHFDPYYMEGANADCGEPMCCRATSGRPKSREKEAGMYGDYRKCDTPKITIDSMLSHIAYTHPDIDYIIWTGDLPPHDIWNQTKESNLEILEETVQQLLHFFPYTPIFPALGNHESAPVNSFPPPFVNQNLGTDWLYKELNRHWQRWLPDSTAPTILKGGFYSVMVTDGFRLISLNMNYCNNKNWWLLLNSTDPAQELQWLIYELHAAEQNGEKVHIIGHIPPGYSDCLKVWSHNYYKIINRYESTITAQFFGHTHYDEYEVFYDEYNRLRATNVAYIGPSVTSYYRLNPGYRIYSVEGEFEGTNRMVTDHETWVMNLNEANRHRVPHWYKLYSARKAFGLRSLHPQEWDNLIYRMSEDDNLFKLYHRYYWKNSVAREDCDAKCKKRMLCDLKSGRSNDRDVTCAKVKRQVDAQERTDWKSWVFSGVTLTSIATTWWYFFMG